MVQVVERRPNLDDRQRLDFAEEEAARNITFLSQNYGKAIEALYRNTSDSGAKNVQGFGALKELCSSSDQSVSLQAQQGLRDYEKYLSRTIGHKK